MAIPTTSRGITRRWPRVPNCSWAGSGAASNWGGPRYRPISRVRSWAAGSRPAIWTTTAEFDLVVVHRDVPAAVLRNGTQGGHWLGLRLRGTRSGRTPVGTRVECRAGGRSQVRWLTSGTSYLASNDPRLWFGLGSAPKVEHLEVRWPSGRVQTWSDIAADRILDIREGELGKPFPEVRRVGRTSIHRGEAHQLRLSPKFVGWVEPRFIEARPTSFAEDFSAFSLSPKPSKRIL